jgi:hypothetical protein
LKQLKLIHLMAVLPILLTSCSSVKYTVDDGRPVDEKLLANIRALGMGEQAIRPAIVKSAQLKDKDCSKQWELPFAVATSYDLKDDDKVAWVRGLHVDERMTVIAAAPEIGLNPGDKITEINGYHAENTTKMSERLFDKRDSGDPFKVKTSEGKTIEVTPVEVCRGHVVLDDPATPDMQDYHWLQIHQPLEIFKTPLTPDEAMWVVLWTQGISEEGGFRMKTYHYGLKLLKSTITVASIASGVGAAVQAAQVAATQAAQIAATTAASAAATAASKAAAQALLTEAEHELSQAVTKELINQAYKQTEMLVANAAVSAAINRNSLSGISWAASTAFEKADQWAFERMTKLGADPLAAFQLDVALAKENAVRNAFVFDKDRLANMEKIADTAGYADKVALILSGKPEVPVIAAEMNNVAPATASSVVDKAPVAETFPLVLNKPDQQDSSVNPNESSQIAVSAQSVTVSPVPQITTTQGAVVPAKISNPANVIAAKISDQGATQASPVSAIQ